MDFIVVGKDDLEYFCLECGQLRFDGRGEMNPRTCGNCGSVRLIVGIVGKLNKEKLKRKYIKRGKS